MVSGNQNVTHLPVYHILLASAWTHYSYYWQYRGRDLWGQLKRRLSYKVSEVPIGDSIALLNANTVTMIFRPTAGYAAGGRWEGLIMELSQRSFANSLLVEVKQVTIILECLLYNI